MVRTVDVTGWFELVLFVLVVILFYLWRQGIKDRIHLASLFALTLIDEHELAHQQRALTQYLNDAKFRSSSILMGHVTSGLTEIAIKLDSKRTDYIRDRLWTISQRISN